MTRRACVDYCLTFPGALEDYPFEDDTPILRHGENRKWFALLLTVDGQPCVNLKCEPRRADFYRRLYADVRPGYHMNKNHWNSVRLDGDVPEEEIKAMIAHSYELTAGSKVSIASKSDADVKKEA